MSGRPSAHEVREWAGEVEALGARIGRHFARSEPRRRAAGYVRGLLSGTERKNGWQLAEHLGEATPDGVQHLLARARWDAGAVRDELAAYAAEHLGEPGGVLAVDETGFLKKGAKSCGVARQYSGTAGRVENCQVGVFLAYVTGRGRALIDRELYLPKEWAQDRDRRRRAGVPAAVGFATKIALAERMVERALAAGVPARWVTADAVYGSDYHFRVTLEGLELGYVVGVRSDHSLWSGFRQARARDLASGLPAAAWRRISCGAGAKGPRWYAWARLPANGPDPKRYRRWLLVRRSPDDPADVAYFLCGGPPRTTLQELVRVAGTRWAVEECFELAKGECGLDEYEVRSWEGWYRHATLSLLALAAVAVIRARALPAPPPRPRRKKGGRG
jgi:SRSO17 transposase